jgi:prepilin-type N-terminal cleavage/methylation domain-containing protein
MRSNGLGKQSGFTLIETLASLAVFVFGAAAVGGLLVSQLRMENSNMSSTQAISLATSELEYLRSLDYPSIPASHITTTTIGPVTYTVDSEATFDSPAASMATIQTTVSWSDPLGAHSYTANAIYTDVTR